MTTRILHVVTAMDAGGIETMLMNIYRNIDRTKIQFDFLYHRTHQSFYDKEINELGGRIYRIRPAKASRIFRYISDLNGFFTNNQYDIVHSHVSILTFFVLRAAKKAGVAVRIGHSHEAHKSLREHRLVRRPLIFLIKPHVSKYCTHRFACGVAAGEWLYGRGREFTVIANAIDTERYRPNPHTRTEMRGELGISNKLVLGHIGNFTRQKNYKFLVEIIKEIRKLREDAVLVLVGNEANDPSVRNFVESSNLSSHVIFTGVRSDVPELLQAMDVFLLPSLSEGLPVALIEAQASGLPCVVSTEVTTEVKVVPHVIFLPVYESARNWVNAISEMDHDVVRKDGASMVANAGYDVKKRSRWMTEFYCSLRN